MQIRFLITSFVLVASAVHASTIQISSVLINESNNLTAGNVFITPDEAWAAAPLGASWISYANTGIGPGSISPDDNHSKNHPAATFTEDFFLPGSINAGSLRIWADDTAFTLLDGAPIGPDANLKKDDACAAGAIAAIGCQQIQFAEISLNGLSQGAHQLTFSVFQVEGGSYGLLYSGSVNSTDGIGGGAIAEVPEPGTLMLIGGGLIGLAAIIRRKSGK
jgi:hypothetical protein